MYTRPTLGLSRGVLTLTGGLDLEEGDLSGAIEEWDEEAEDWVVAEAEVRSPTWRHAWLQLPTRLMDHCDKED